MEDGKPGIKGKVLLKHMETNRSSPDFDLFRVLMAAGVQNGLMRSLQMTMRPPEEQDLLTRGQSLHHQEREHGRGEHGEHGPQVRT